jgi:NSS family neurotransmitter:Na+ symporter
MFALGRVRGEQPGRATAGAIPSFADRTFFDVIDYVTSNILLPISAFATAVFVGWRLPAALLDEGFAQASPVTRRMLTWVLRLVCPLALIFVMVSSLV